MAPVRPGREFTELLVDEANQAFATRLMERPAVVGETLVVDTGWLAALFYSDHSVHDWPDGREAELRRRIDESFTHLMVASDFGALDVRVGAALCIRAQREMQGLVAGTPVPGPVQPPEAVRLVVERVCAALDAEDADALTAIEAQYEATSRTLEARIATLSEELEAESISRQDFYTKRKETAERLLAARLGRRFAQCMRLALERGERDYSALRDAFVAEIDIHTFTGMKLIGRNPMEEFKGLDRATRKKLEKQLKHELGPRRQQGKIANLSLLYGMMDAGFQEAAARGYDEHWSLEEAGSIRRLWMDAYPEVELWHLWTECLQAGMVYLPQAGTARPKRTPWWLSRTLAGREIVAFGLNAALSYQDQSSGADILGTITHTLQKDHSHIFATSFNQVHDEQVFCVPAEHCKEYLEVIERVMVGCGNLLTMPYGVPCAVSPAVGPIWVKD
jgi:hypothetical protein